MSDSDTDQFEAELRSLRPAKLPVGTREQILATIPSKCLDRRQVSVWANYLRWLIPATALMALSALIFRHTTISPKHQTAAVLEAASTSPLKADKVEIDRQLLAHFDAVGRLPDGRAVRFQCAQWLDKVRVRDTAAGLLIERSSPRLEIVPIGFETY